MSFWKNYISAVFLLMSFTLTTAFAPRSLFSRPTTQYTSCEPSSKTRLFLTTIQAEEDKYLEWAMQGEGVMAKPDVVYVRCHLFFFSLLKCFMTLTDFPSSFFFSSGYHVQSRDGTRRGSHNGISTWF